MDPMCVCVREREWEREKESVCVREKERECVCVLDSKSFNKIIVVFCKLSKFNPELFKVHASKSKLYIFFQYEDKIWNVCFQMLILTILGYQIYNPSVKLSNNYKAIYFLTITLQFFKIIIGFPWL